MALKVFLASNQLVERFQAVQETRWVLFSYNTLPDRAQKMLSSQAAELLLVRWRERAGNPSVPGSWWRLISS